VSHSCASTYLLTIFVSNSLYINLIS
jgi:hypothetical protein